MATDQTLSEAHVMEATVVDHADTFVTHYTKHMPRKPFSESPPAVAPELLLAPVRELILAAREQIVQSVNSTLTLLDWQIGHRLLHETLDDERGRCGDQVLRSMARELEAEFGKGFNYSALTRMVRFAETFPDEAIVATLSQQLSWSHVVALLPVKELLAREFYAEMCRVERWSVRTLRQKIGGMLYERMALSRESETLILGRSSPCCVPRIK